MVGSFGPAVYLDASEILVCEDCEHRTVQSAIDSAWSGDIVVIDKGVYRENLSINRPITIRGAGAEKTIIKSAEAGKPVLSIESREVKVDIENITLEGARARGEKKEDINFASGVYIQGKSNRLEVRNCSFKDNDGWGIYLKGSSKLVAGNIEASSNQKGGIAVKEDAIVKLDDSNLVNNNGSGIFAEGGRKVNIESTRIAGNTRGVHFYLSPEITLKDSVIEKNGSGILTYMDLFRGEIKGSGNVVSDSVSPPLEWGMKVGYWPENFLSTDLTFSTYDDKFPYDDLSLPEGLEFQSVNYDKLLGLERQELLSGGPEVVFIWGKGQIDYIPNPEYNPVSYRPYVLNKRGYLMGIAGEIPKKSHLFSIYFTYGSGWKPAFFIPADETMSTHKEEVKVEVRDLIYSSSGKEIMVRFKPRSPTSATKRFLLNWAGDRLKIFHKSDYSRYRSSEKYGFNTYVKQMPVMTCFETAVHSSPASFCYRQYRYWDGNEYDTVSEDLSWWGFDLDLDMSGNCRKAVKEMREDFNSGLISYRSDPLSLARQLKGTTDASYWQVFKENGLAIIYRIEGGNKERLFAYQPFYNGDGNGEGVWVLTDENLHDKGKQLGKD